MSVHVNMAWKKHIEVKVLVNGMAAQEHDDDDDDEGSNGRYTITKYIEAVSGVQFAVQFELKPSFFFRAELFVFQIYIDGKRLDSAIVAKSRFEEQPRGCTGNFHGITRSHGQTWSVEKFRFSEIKISESIFAEILPA